ncbi:hypothetical protein OIU83_15965 [Flavobacterium sp. LS1R49]|uniref:Lipoprotein n=1 Tax=Flavobacterium shii TaxID=2987687 RepID=A0A9X2ZI77_9FLAO|nr:hypothetical protein [Flavobacterium shii]MCV9929162.1 hypothetical protein [Flavobacterium shii]
MKKIKLQSVLFVLFLVTALSSCSSDSDKTTTPALIAKSAFVTEVTGPATGKVNEELSYNVMFMVENGCGEFNKFTEIQINKEIGVQVEAKYSSATCEDTKPQFKRTIHKAIYSNKGTYYMRFAKSETEFITIKVVIE